MFLKEGVDFMCFFKLNKNVFFLNENLKKISKVA